MRARGALIPPTERGNVLGGNGLETQEWRFCETLSDREG